MAGELGDGHKVGATAHQSRQAGVTQHVRREPEARHARDLAHDGVGGAQRKARARTGEEHGRLRGCGDRRALGKTLVEDLAHQRVQWHLAQQVALSGPHDDAALARGDLDVVEIQRHRLRQSQCGEEHQHDERAVTGACALAGAQQLTLIVLLERARRRAHRLLPAHVRVAKAALAIQRIQRREREIHRRRRRAPLDLQPAPKVPGGMVAREAIAERVGVPAVVAGRGEPVEEHAHVAPVLALGALGQRLTLEPALELRPSRHDVAELPHPGADPICRCGGSPLHLVAGHALSPPAMCGRRIRSIPLTHLGERSEMRMLSKMRQSPGATPDHAGIRRPGPSHLG
ncbi:MAG: hypothetical protein QOJ85_3954, partial [Solirubrobacteraceae bacterium]|nr:hypothetical protein [Solirubrobacteraceae bacterium]